MDEVEYILDIELHIIQRKLKLYLTIMVLILKVIRKEQYTLKVKLIQKHGHNTCFIMFTNGKCAL